MKPNCRSSSAPAELPNSDWVYRVFFLSVVLRLAGWKGAQERRARRRGNLVIPTCYYLRMYLALVHPSVASLIDLEKLSCCLCAYCWGQPANVELAFSALDGSLLDLPCGGLGLQIVALGPPLVGVLLQVAQVGRIQRPWKAVGYNFRRRRRLGLPDSVDAPPGRRRSGICKTASPASTASATSDNRGKVVGLAPESPSLCPSPLALHLVAYLCGYALE